MINHVILPIPPSDNALFANRKPVAGKKAFGRVKTAEYRAWLIEAGYVLNLAHLTPIESWYHWTMFLPETMAGDAGNRNKAVPDLFKRHGIVKDDKLERSHQRQLSETVPSGRCSVFIYPHTATRAPGGDVARSPAAVLPGGGMEAA